MISESVWDYPRPPRVEQVSRLVKVSFGGRVIAETRLAQRVLETSHPPVFYIPPGDIAPGVLTRTTRTSLCEFKGVASYYTVRVGERKEENAAWFYPAPSPGYEAIRDHVAFYPARMDECTVDGESVHSQAGGFYGGWITSEVRGPFKGEPGTQGW